MTCRCVVLSFMVLLVSAMPTSAQGLSSPGQWVGDLYLVDHPGDILPSKHLIDEKNQIQRTIPHISKVIDFPVPLAQRVLPAKSFWHNDALYVLTAGGKKTDMMLEDGSIVTRWMLAKWQDGEWRFLGDYKTEPKNILVSIPCDNDRFIVIASKNDLTGNKDASKRTPFHRMSLYPEKEELRLNTAIDHGVDDIRGYMSNPDCFSMAFNSAIAITDDYAVVVNCETGLYWIFSLENASLKHVGNIFKNITPELIAKGGFPNAILRVHPEKAGTVLISAQEESAFLTESGDAVKETQELLDKNPDLSPEDVKKTVETRREELSNRSPLLVWYRIDPERGKTEKLGVPPVGAAYVREGTKTDYWRPMPDGSVRMGSLDSFLVEKTEKPSGADKQQAISLVTVCNERCGRALGSLPTRCSMR